MKQKRTLYFESAGCVPCGDVENCRIRTAYTNKNGEVVYLELGGSDNAYEFYTDRKGNRKAKSISGAFGHVEFAFITKPTKGEGGVTRWNDCNSNRYPARKIENANYSFEYSKAEILRIVNEYFDGDFDEVVILPCLSDYRVHKDNVSKIDYGNYGECPFNLSDDFIYDKSRTEQAKKIKAYFDDYEKTVMGKHYPNNSVYFEHGVLKVLIHYNCYNDRLEIPDVFAFDFNYQRPNSEILRQARERHGIYSNVEWLR